MSRLAIVLVSFVLLAVAGCFWLQDRQSAPDSSARVEMDVDQLVRFVERPFRDEIIYFLLTDRFSNADTDNDRGFIDGDRLAHGYDASDEMFYHGGDLKGLTGKLDYLANMGVTAIWITPVFKNKPVQSHGGYTTAGYHGYWITDFTTIDPHLGTENDFRELVAAAHRRDMKVILDIVVNHTANVISYRECKGDQCNFRSSQDYPYSTQGPASGKEINSGFAGDDKLHQTIENFEKLVDPAFAYRPYIPDAEADLKKPGWLNDTIHYHNRGELVFNGEAFFKGDFYGLDDLFTEHPTVVNGMIDIYQYWIREFGIDGFRIDTAGHVNREFWQQFSPAISQYATEHGRPEFFMFGEVVDTVLNKRSYVTDGNLPAVLDFDFRHAIVDYVVHEGSARALADFFENDDYFVDHNSTPYDFPTFVSNHDDGRIGILLQKDADASDELSLRRMRLAYAMLYFSRGVPIIYYGDEQGFSGDPGFHGSREDMFPSKVSSFNDNDLVDSDVTTAASNFDNQHSLYTHLKELARVYRQHVGLRRGDQIARYSDLDNGVIAFSRIDQKELLEFLVVFNSSQDKKRATIPVSSASKSWDLLSGNSDNIEIGDHSLTVTMAPVSFAVFKARDAMPLSNDAPGIAFSNLRDGDTLACNGFVDIDVEETLLSHVGFEVRESDQTEWRYLGTDTNKPYRIYFDVEDYSTATSIRLRATTDGYSTATNTVSVQLRIEPGREKCDDMAAS